MSRESSKHKSNVTFGLLLLIAGITALGGVRHMNAQETAIRVEPPNWWAGMRNPRLQLMLYGKEIANYTPEIKEEGVALDSWHPGASANYLFLDLSLDPGLEPGEVEINLARRGFPDQEVSYEIRTRQRAGEDLVGFDASDVIYLITPDRFANGIPENDSVSGMREQGTDRSDDYARHGGDLEGIRQHLEYIAGMGFTAIWPTPLLTNDMPRTSYHGYAITDFYQVDPRFGTLQAYIELSKEARRKGLKLIMDQVVNHCGLSHWWMEDLPFSDWINYQENHEKGQPITVTNHRRTVNQDPYAAEADRILMEKGWFVPSMPDLNQDNPFLATYLIQNSIWWVETLQLGGIRQDTYPYPDKDFLARWAREIMEEYPNFNIVGEEWSTNPLLVAYWQDGAPKRDSYRSYLRTTMDFPLQKALVDGLTAQETWGTGLIGIYEALANDFHYASPRNLLFFGDNHDMDRLYTQLGESVALTQMALAFILTTPRIPQVYYGTELLMENSAKPGDHGLIRSDFPGGWEGDLRNGFTGAGLTSQEKEMQLFLRKILKFRQRSPAIHKGETLHFVPEDGVYILARSLKNETVVLVLNKNEGPVTVPLSRYAELGLSGKPMNEILSGKTVIWSGSLTLKEPGAYIYTTE
ncbi:glycoside hydrolase family 13 protein [Robiginitalea aurantiaca]|uniref:Glycoside hydrolase family 13 protein n=1 Tax=Robiginitalea aurantiaca TaxID=3056915 RepID=A0ABT7WES7_9FLAO|nr:glycoside hydrolase family 13 protein [Robiginitalea aurantiaca]MDM9631420.1 glycoside hydrolase family 13 protein [Robiginitalea aurantiaca]